MGFDFDRLDRMSVPELVALERGEERAAEEHRNAAAEARTPPPAVDPMDRDPLADDDSPRDRYWTSAADRMNGAG